MLVLVRGAYISQAPGQRKTQQKIVTSHNSSQSHQHLTHRNDMNLTANSVLTSPVPLLARQQVNGT